MAIPETQLETWSHQGSVTQSANTYATIKRALENANANYSNRNFEVFLQGSYGNDTNIFAESDVDVVVRQDGEFYHDLKELPEDQKQAFQTYFRDGTYPYNAFKGHVQAALTDAFGNSVKLGNRAIKIEASGSRRNADVIVAFEFRRYYKFNGAADQRYDTGVTFFTSDGKRIANYPKQHSTNLTTKHQSTSNNFKPLVRIFKNMRGKLVEDSLIVPNDKFSGSYAGMVLGILRWLRQTTDRTKFVCANEQYYLLRDNEPVCWPVGNGGQFINAAAQLWDNWR